MKIFQTEKDDKIAELELHLTLLQRKYSNVNHLQVENDSLVTHNIKLEYKVGQLEAEITTLKGQVEIANEKAKSAYADHIINAEDTRYKTLEDNFKMFTDKTLEVVKACVQPDRLITIMPSGVVQEVKNK